MTVDLPDDLVDAVTHKLDPSNIDEPDDLDESRLSELAARILDQRDSTAERLRIAEARIVQLEADLAKWKGRAEALVNVTDIGSIAFLARRLVQLLDERGHGAVDRELQDLIDLLRPAVTG